MKRIATDININRTPQFDGSLASMKSLKAHTSYSTRSTNSIRKTSVRMLLQDKVSLLENTREVTLDLTYHDIKVNKRQEIVQEIQNFLCYNGFIGKPKKCLCFDGKKCEWVGKWIMMFPEVKSPKVGQVSDKILKQIDLDLERTSNNVCSLPEAEFKRILRKTLTSYCLTDPELNYVQGFNYLTAAITVHTKNVHDSFKVLSFIMKERNLREIYLSDFSLTKKHSRRIVQVLKNKCNSLYAHLITMQVDLDMFVIGWLIPLFSNLVHQEYMHLVIDNFLSKGWPFVYAFCLTMMIYLRDELLEMDYQEDILVTLSVQSLISRGMPWEEIILASGNFPISRKEVYTHGEITSVL